MVREFIRMFPLGKGSRNNSRITQIEASRTKAAEEAATLKRGETPWHHAYDRAKRGFADTFYQLLVNRQIAVDQSEQVFDDYLRTRFPDGIIGIELGGPGGNLFKGINDQVVRVKQSFGVTLAAPTERALGYTLPPFHSFLEGDLNQHATFENIIARLEGKKADLIISDMIGGLQYLAEDPYFFAQEIAYLYRQALSSTGVILLTIPEYFGPFLEEWKKVVNQSGITINFSESADYFTLKIERNPQSPDELPLLGLKELKRAYASMKT